MLNSIFSAVINITISASIIAMVVIILRFLIKSRIPKTLVLLLWAIVIIKFAVPFDLPSPTSIYNTTPLTNITQVVNKTVIHNNTTNTPIQTQAVTTNITEATNPSVNNSAPTKQDNPLNLVDVLPIIWLIIASFMFLFFIINYFIVNFNFKKAVLIKNVFIEDFINQYNLKRKINVYKSSAVNSPVVFGILNPKIYLPLDFEIDNETMLTHILAHEMEHIKRFDNLTNFILLLILCVHWFNPILWISKVLISNDIETACDEGALHRIGEQNKNVYAHSLLAIAQQNSRFSPTVLIAFGGTSVKSRIKGILKYKKITVASVVAVVVIICTVMVFLVTGALSHYTYTGEMQYQIYGKILKLEQKPMTKEQELIVNYYKNDTANSLLTSIIIHRISTLSTSDYSVKTLKNGETNFNYYSNAWLNTLKQQNKLNSIEVINIDFTQQFKNGAIPDDNDGRYCKNFIIGAVKGGNYKIITTDYNYDPPEFSNLQQTAKALIQNDYIAETIFGLGQIPSEWNGQSREPSDSFLVTSDKYKSLKDLSDLLSNTFTKQTADKFLNNPNGFGSVFVEKGGKLYIYPYRLSMSGDNTFNKDLWDKMNVSILSKTDSTVEIESNFIMEQKYLKLFLTMKKENGKWLLTDKVSSGWLHTDKVANASSQNSSNTNSTSSKNISSSQQQSSLYRSWEKYVVGSSDWYLSKFIRKYNLIMLNKDFDCNDKSKIDMDSIFILFLEFSDAENIDFSKYENKTDKLLYFPQDFVENKIKEYFNLSEIDRNSCSFYKADKKDYVHGSWSYGSANIPIVKSIVNNNEGIIEVAVENHAGAVTNPIYSTQIFTFIHTGNSYKIVSVKHTDYSS